MIRGHYIYRAMCAGFLLSGSTGCLTEPATSAQTEPNTGNDLVTVKTLLPQKTSLRRTTTQPATIHAYHQAEIYAKVTGYLKELNVDIGQQVDAGEVLGTIDVPELDKSLQRQQATVDRLRADQRRAEAEITVAKANVESAAALLAQAKAQLKADKIEYERIRNLAQERAIAERLSDEALNRYEAAEAAVASAEANQRVAAAKLEAAGADFAAAAARIKVAQKQAEELDALIKYATLTAPFTGIVTQRSADPGDLIRNAPASSGPNSPPLFVIAQLDKVRVCVQVPERDAPWANDGDPATLTFQALPGQSFSGTVSRVAGCLDESTRTMTVEIDLDNPQHKLLPGMFGQATIVLEEQNDSLVLPAGAVRYDATGRSYVYAIDSADKVQVVDVAVGLDDGLLIEITGGLTGTQRVADAMLGRLKPGQKVRVQNP